MGAAQRIALVESAKALKLALGSTGIDTFGQHGAAEAAALHVYQLVDEHVARGADVARKAVAAAQQHRLGVGAPVGEFGEVQLHPFHAFQCTAGHQCVDVGIVGNLQGFFGVGACWCCAVSNDLHSSYLGA